MKEIQLRGNKEPQLQDTTRVKWMRSTSQAKWRWTSL